MRARIHRGAHQIGGNCIEVEAAGTHLVLDLGRPLDAGWNDHVPLPDVAGLADPDPSLAGVVLSHPHLDHYGLAEQLHADVPVYLGAEAAKVLEAAAFFSPMTKPPKLAGTLRHLEPLALGPFTVTPHLADHSAFDAYSLLVEAGGSSLFYTGDIRGHGRKRRLFEALVRQPPKADVLLMEGTNVRPGASSTPVTSEHDVEAELLETIKRTDGMVAVFSSAQNLDRLSTVFRATLRSGRTLVVDLYTATVATATGRDSLPHPRVDRLAVYVPQRQRVLVKRAEEFDRVSSIRPIRLFREDLAADPGKYVYLGTSSTCDELLDARTLEGGTVVWSLWTGYLKDSSGAAMRAKLDAAGVPLVVHHASGHASPEDLRRLADAFAPARVVPIHSEATDKFGEHFERVELHPDGEWWEV